MKIDEFSVGDFVRYSLADNNPTFMMWHEIDPKGRPTLDWHPHVWGAEDTGVVIETYGLGDLKFLRLLKPNGGVGWVSAWRCEK